MGFASTLELPYPRLVEGRFASIDALTDEGLFDAVGVRIAFTARGGGISEPPYDSLNLGDHVGDDGESVAENRARLLAALGAESSFVVNPLQVHGDRIVAVPRFESAERALGEAREGADAVVVECDDVAALLCFADCMPVIIAAPDGSFAVIHAGWRGVDNRIAAHAVLRLARESGCDPSGFNAYIGPYIHACHFEVGVDLARRFASSFGESVSSFGDGCARVDLGEAMRIQLLSVGIDGERIADAGICTVCNQDAYFSYRGSGGTCGRHAAIAVRPSSGRDASEAGE